MSIRAELVGVSNGHSATNALRSPRDLLTGSSLRETPAGGVYCTVLGTIEFLMCPAGTSPVSTVRYQGTDMTISRHVFFQLQARSARERREHGIGH
jgi:hypothetical protein